MDGNEDITTEQLLEREVEAALEGAFRGVRRAETPPPLPTSRRDRLHGAAISGRIQEQQVFVPLEVEAARHSRVGLAREWFLRVHQVVTGPYTLGQVRQLRAAGDLHDGWSCWHRGFPGWVAVAHVRELGICLPEPASVHSAPFAPRVSPGPSVKTAPPAPVEQGSAATPVGPAEPNPRLAHRPSPWLVSGWLLAFVFGAFAALRPGPMRLPERASEQRPPAISPAPSAVSPALPPESGRVVPASASVAPPELKPATLTLTPKPSAAPAVARPPARRALVVAAPKPAPAEPRDSSAAAAEEAGGEELSARQITPERRAHAQAVDDEFEKAFGGSAEP